MLDTASIIVSIFFVGVCQILLGHRYYIPGSRSPADVPLAGCLWVVIAFGLLFLHLLGVL